MIKVAVVILNWNGHALLEKFLPHVMANSAEPDTKIYVADNASKDQSIYFLKTNYPEIGIVELDKNYGYAGGYNKALKHIEAKYYVLLNSDVAPKPNWLKPLINAAENNPNLAACMPKILDFKNPTKFEYAGASGGYIDYLGYPFCRGRILNINEQDTNQYNSNVSVFWASGAALFIRSDVYQMCEGFDEHFFAHMEEIDLCWQIKNRGYEINCIPESEVLHVGGATLSQQNSQKTFLNFRNNLLILIKNTHSRKIIFTLFIRMILDGVAFFFFALKGEFKHSIAVIRAHFSFYALLPVFYKKRKALKSTIKVKEHPEIYARSIILSFYVLRIKHFSSLTSFSLKFW